MPQTQRPHLVFLGSGDAALTRRATKASSLSAVVASRQLPQALLCQPDNPDGSLRVVLL
jgi:hypothetical protein